MKRYAILTTIFASLLCLPPSFAAERNSTQEDTRMESTVKAGKNFVTFKSQGVNLSGLLYTPAEFDESTQAFATTRPISLARLHSP